MGALVPDSYGGWRWSDSATTGDIATRDTSTITVGGRNNGKSFLAKEYWMFSNMPKIKKVIFNKPATIIIWVDKSKTVVKCMDGDEWDPEKGFVMAYLTKLIGQKQLHAALKEYVKPQVKLEEGSESVLDAVTTLLKNAFNGKTTYQILKEKFESLDEKENK